MDRRAKRLSMISRKTGLSWDPDFVAARSTWPLAHGRVSVPHVFVGQDSWLSGGVEPTLDTPCWRSCGFLQNRLSTYESCNKLSGW